MIKKNPTNTNTPRTLDIIYLQPLDNKQGGNECIHLQTGGVITCHNTRDITVTDLVIIYLEEMEGEQVVKNLKLKEGTKFHYTLTIWFKERTTTMTKMKIKTKNINMRIKADNMIMKNI